MWLVATGHVISEGPSNVVRYDYLCIVTDDLFQLIKFQRTLLVLVFNSSGVSAASRHAVMTFFPAQSWSHNPIILAYVDIFAIMAANQAHDLKKLSQVFSYRNKSI